MSTLPDHAAAPGEVGGLPRGVPGVHQGPVGLHRDEVVCELGEPVASVLVRAINQCSSHK